MTRLRLFLKDAWLYGGFVFGLIFYVNGAVDHDKWERFPGLIILCFWALTIKDRVRD